MTQVVAFIKAWRDSGGRTALVTASDSIFASAIAHHLGLFDEAHGSDGQLNLKGHRKGQFLEERFGLKGFCYIGDAKADLSVWKRASKAITVNAPSDLRRHTEKVCENVEHLGCHSNVGMAYVKALRPHQWLKNGLVFLPTLAAHQLDGVTFLLALLAFISFGLVASSVYVLNDLLDLAADRMHPRKCLRPFASGSIPIAHGIWMAGGLLLLGALLAFIISTSFLLVMACYYILTLAYSLNLKRRMVVDICVLAGLYTMRIIAGGVATDISLSVWLLVFSVFFFLSLASVKRQAELIDIAVRL